MERIPETLPLVSVVIASYNCERYVEQAIESVLGQTYSNLEVHLVDDGSTDGTEATVARFLSDRRMHYHKQVNQGQTVAKNRGISASQGEFVAFCDADDIWLPEKLAVQIPVFSAHEQVGVVYSRCVMMDEHGMPLPSEPQASNFFRSGRITRELFKENFVTFGTAVIRRSCLRELGQFDERYRMGIDWELWLRLSTRYEFFFVDSVTYVYRIWPGQMSGNWRGRYENAFRIMRDFLERHPDLLERGVVKEAWADCYANRALWRISTPGQYLHAFGDVGLALFNKPNYYPAWRALAYLLLRLSGLRRR